MSAHCRSSGTGPPTEVTLTHTTRNQSEFPFCWVSTAPFCWLTVITGLPYAGSDCVIIEVNVIENIKAMKPSAVPSGKASGAVEATEGC